MTAPLTARHAIPGARSSKALDLGKAAPRAREAALRSTRRGPAPGKMPQGARPDPDDPHRSQGAGAAPGRKWAGCCQQMRAGRPRQRPSPSDPKGNGGADGDARPAFGNGTHFLGAALHGELRAARDGAGAAPPCEQRVSVRHDPRCRPPPCWLGARAGRGRRSPWRRCARSVSGMPAPLAARHLKSLGFLAELLRSPPVIENRWGFWRGHSTHRQTSNIVGVSGDTALLAARQLISLTFPQRPLHLPPDPQNRWGFCRAQSDDRQAPEMVGVCARCCPSSSNHSELFRWYSRQLNEGTPSDWRHSGEGLSRVAPPPVGLVPTGPGRRGVLPAAAERCA